MPERSPQFARQGSLGEIAPANLIRAIYEGRRSGILHLTTGDASKRLYFREGALVLAGSDLFGERMGQWLLRAGRIGEADLERALRIAETTGNTIGETVVELGILRSEEMQTEAARRAMSIVESVLSWDSGDYFFEEREEYLEGEPQSDLPVPEILLEGIRRVKDARVIRRLLDDGKGVPRRAETPPSLSQGLSLTPSEGWAVAQVNGVSPAEEIAAVCPLGEEMALQAICGLLFAGVLELQPTSAAPRPESGTAGEDLFVAGDLLAALEAELAGRRALVETIGAPSGLLQPRLPEKLGRYLIQQLIGRGSMGAVLLARDPDIDRQVAIKLIQTSVHLTPPELEKYKERFYREARAAGRLMHPCIVTVFDVGHSPDGIPFIVMEWVKGRTLSEWQRTEEPELPEVLRLATRCLEALHHAHSQGIVHRDLKPANIMVTPEGQPKIMDFGVAHVVGSEMTHAEEILGSPYYMAPEQLGNKIVDQRTDVFAFGVILYSILTGELPFAGDSFAAIAQAVLSKNPVPPDQSGRGVPPALAAIVMRCLEKEPERRFRSAAELKEALASLEGTAAPRLQGEAVPIPEPRTPPPGSRRVRMPVVLALLLGAIPIVLFLWFSARSPRGKEPSGSAAVERSPGMAPPAESPQGQADEPSEAELLYEASLAAERGELESSERMLRELLRRNPGFSGASDLLRRVEELKWRNALPLVFSARHDHMIGGCSGVLRLDASGVEYRSEKHGLWRWSFSDIRLMEREDPRLLRIETREKELLTLGKPKSYSFSLLESSLTDEDWTRYQRLAK